MDKDKARKSAIRELLIFLWLTLFGLLFLPMAIFLVGKLVFGEYGGTGFGAFYGTLHRALRDADPVVLFLVFSPYLVWQLARLTSFAFRRAWQNRHTAGA